MSPPDVVIVGGGLAGLSAARALPGTERVVLDANEWWGGRTRSWRWDDAWCNLGAQYIYDDLTWDLVRSLGVQTVPTAGLRNRVRIRNRFVSLDHPVRMFFQLPITVRERVAVTRAFLRVLPILRKYPDVDREQLDAQSFIELAGGLADQPIVAELFDLLAYTTSGAHAREVSAYIALPYALNTYQQGLDSFGAVVGGTNAIAQRMRETSDTSATFISSAQVHRVTEAGTAGVTVDYTDAMGDHSIDARYAIVATPAPVSAQIVPGLPEDHARALLEIPYRTVISIGYLLRRNGAAAWDDANITLATDQLVRSFYNNSQPARRAGLFPDDRDAFVGLINLDAADPRSATPDAQLSELAITDLDRVFPSAGALVDDVVVQRWQQGLPVLGPGTLARRSVVRQPRGLIHFCGDYTHSPGIEGAVGSGTRTGRAVADLLSAGA